MIMKYLCGMCVLCICGECLVCVWFVWCLCFVIIVWSLHSVCAGVCSDCVVSALYVCGLCGDCLVIDWGLCQMMLLLFEEHVMIVWYVFGVCVVVVW